MRCKIGDLAIIVNAINKQNIGKLVRVIDRHDGSQDYNGVRWREDAKSCEWIIQSEGTPLISYPLNEKSGPFWDKWLRPIRPVEDQESETETKKIIDKVMS